MGQAEKRGCFKFGCLSALGGCAVLILVIGALLGIGLWTGSGEERFESIERTHVLSQPRVRPSGEIEEPGRIVLDLTRGSFSIRPGAPGEHVRLEGEYDAGKFELTEVLEPYGESGWIYRVSFDQRGFGIRPFVQHDGLSNHLTLVVPPDVPVSLEGYVGIGESAFELGGLWLTDVDLEMGIGDHALGFAEPLAVPLERFRLDTSLGVLRVASLGNASPRKVEARHSVGETTIDLGGEWRRDAQIFIGCGVGECDVRVPENVNVELEQASVLIGESGSSLRKLGAAPNPALPTLELSVSARIGELRVHH